MADNKYLKSRSGAASLIVTIILMIAVVSIVGTLTVITLRDVKQSGDLDQSSRALNAARAGAQQLANKLNLDPTYQQPTCNGNTPGHSAEVQVGDPGSGQDIAITCSQLFTSGVSSDNYLLRDQSVTYDLHNAHKAIAAISPGPVPYTKDPNFANIVYMSLRWNDTSTDVTDTSTYTAPDLAYPDWPELLVPKQAGFRPERGNKVEPASFELTVSWCPRLNTTNPASSDYSKCDYSQSFLDSNGGGEPTMTTLIRPGTANKDTNTDAYGNVLGATSDCFTNPGFLTNLACQTPKSIYCDAAQHARFGCTIGYYYAAPLDLSQILWRYIKPYNGIPAMQTPYYQDATNNNLGFNHNILKKYILSVKIKPRYASTHYAISFLDSNADPVYINFPYAKIQVTARSGNVYRSISSTKYTTFSSFNYLDNALFSGKNICKNLVIYKNSGGPNNMKNTCTEP